LILFFFDFFPPLSGFFTLKNGCGSNWGSHSSSPFINCEIIAIDLRPAEISWSLQLIKNAMIFRRSQENGHIESQKLRQKRTAEQGMKAADGGRHRRVGVVMAGIWPETAIKE
jgi:hypothetical protein